MPPSAPVSFSAATPPTSWPHQSPAPAAEGPVRGPTLVVMSTVEQPEEPVLHLYAPDEARKRARPLPPPDKLIVEGVTDEEWKAFQEALAAA